MKMTKEEFKETLYNSLFNITELLLESLRHYIPELFTVENLNERIIFIDQLKKVTHKQKKRSHAEVEENKYDDFVKFFGGVHLENIRQLCLRIQIEMQNIQKNTKADVQIIRDVEEIKNYLEGCTKWEIGLIAEYYKDYQDTLNRIEKNKENK
jgi:hypothetical protein